ncbi:DNA alkylation repair protein [Selenomonadales bacterium OttesenSCG-928-I06]|nr:DNA alkylation repair protein [Selenomonadales bacterium OttesenSCG-928-I06]
MKKDLNDEIFAKLSVFSEEKHKKFTSSLTPNAGNVLGVKIPLLRKMAKELAKGDWQTYLQNVRNKYFEEIMLEGMVIGYAKMSVDERLNYIDSFVPKINNWAVCDIFVTGLKFAKENKEIVFNFLKKYFSSDKEFEVRFAIVMFLSFYIEEEYIKKVLEILNKVNHEDYYAKMAIAWAISVCYVKFPDLTLEFLKNNNLDKFTHNKSIQKIIESYRVEKADKELVSQMRRR